jgi:hypothetical protein
VLVTRKFLTTSMTAAGLLGLRVVAGALDDLQTGIGDAGGEHGLVLRRKQPVIAAGQHQRWDLDFAKPVHDVPALIQLGEAKEEWLGPGFHAQCREEHVWYLRGAEIGIIGAGQLARIGNHLLWLDLAVAPAAGNLYRLRAEAAPGQQLRGVLSWPPGVAAGVHQDEVRQAVRVTERIFQGHLAAKGVAENGPLVEAELLA